MGKIFLHVNGKLVARMCHTFNTIFNPKTAFRLTW